MHLAVHTVRNSHGRSKEESKLGLIAASNHLSIEAIKCLTIEGLGWQFGGRDCTVGSEDGFTATRTVVEGSRILWIIDNDESGGVIVNGLIDTHGDFDGMLSTTVIVSRPGR
jgi:hypothetical protein